MDGCLLEIFSLKEGWEILAYGVMDGDCYISRISIRMSVRSSLEVLIGSNTNRSSNACIKKKQVIRLLWHLIDYNVYTFICIKIVIK